MRAALLNLARAEAAICGFVTEHTRRRLQLYGVYSVQLEQYLAAVGVTE